MTASIDHLHATMPDVVADETAVARVAPVTHAHVNSLGRYDCTASRRPQDTCDRYGGTWVAATGPS